MLQIYQWMTFNKNNSLMIDTLDRYTTRYKCLQMSSTSFSCCLQFFDEAEHGLAIPISL